MCSIKKITETKPKQQSHALDYKLDQNTKNYFKLLFVYAILTEKYPAAYSFLLEVLSSVFREFEQSSVTYLK